MAAGGCAMERLRQPSEKYVAARNSLPMEQRSVFDEMVLDYQHAAHKFHRRRFVSHVVLAEMVRIGWRHSAETTA
jgi:hypothetical protein